MPGRKTPWIGTSWKMNKTRPQARAFAEALRGSALLGDAKVRPFVIPPFTAIAEVSAILEGSRVRVGGQNMHWATEGAWTGEISAPMLLDAGASLVEIGHSERRTHFGETDETVGMKTRAAVDAGLTALVCIGETRRDYEAGRTGEVLARQVEAALSGVGKGAGADIVLAYEPVWSIGEGGTPAEPSFVEVQHRRIKAVAAECLGRPLEVVYGGSVNPGNCRELVEREGVDGLFIGRSAWTPEGYLGIVELVSAHLAR
jgi:L-erythrulose 1-phosphate isomerase